MLQALEGGEWSAPRLGHFTPGKETRYPFYRKLGELWGRCGWVRKVSPLLGFEPQTVQSVTSRYTDYAIPLNKEEWKFILIKPERRGWCLIRDHYISILCSDSVLWQRVVGWVLLRRFGGTWWLHLQIQTSFRNCLTMKMNTPESFETSRTKRPTTQRRILVTFCLRTHLLARTDPADPAPTMMKS